MATKADKKNAKKEAKLAAKAEKQAMREAKKSDKRLIFVNCKRKPSRANGKNWCETA